MTPENFLTAILATLVASQDNVTRAMTAEDFLRAHDHNSKFISSQGSRFGRMAREEYEASYGEQPPQINEVINGRERLVYIYPHGRQDALRYAWRRFNSPNSGNTEKKG